ncbi:MAG: DUF1684 domain-containing protein [Gemmatimonadales bacterium]
MFRHALVPLGLVVVTACEPAVPALTPIPFAAYEDTIAHFHAKRVDGVAGPEGWATLLGLWWLKPGENRMGSDSSLEIVLPADRSPRRLGSVRVEADSARFEPAAGVKVFSDSLAVSAPLTLHSDVEGKQTVIRFGSLVVGYITRSGRKGLRIKDTLHVARTTFPGHHYFPTDTAWRIQARFVPRPKPDSMHIIDVLGIETWMSWPGELRFRVNGRRYSLQVIREPEDHGKRLFVMFRDSTNGRETYPAMRYTYVDVPDSLGRTWLDFNQSYSPPCAFTSFATCPLPPKGNSLPFRVPAGELKPAGHL